MGVARLHELGVLFPKQRGPEAAGPGLVLFSGRHHRQELFKVLYAGALLLDQHLEPAQAAGLDAKRVAGVISKGAAQSWQMDNRAETMINDEFEFGFAVEWMRKDIGIAMAEARSNGALLPATALVDQLYGEVVAMGGSRWDTSSLIMLLTRKAG